MKKFTIVLLSMLLVLSIGQATFAKGGVDLKVGYMSAPQKSFHSGLNIKASGEYHFTNWFALSGGVRSDLYFGSLSNILEFNLDAKFTVLSTTRFNLGLQVDLKDSLLFMEDGTKNYFAVGVGIFADYDISDKFNIYLDVKSPFFYVVSDSRMGFGPFFDVTLGAEYAINSKVDIGLEVGANYSEPIFDFTVGAKVGYNF